MKIKKNKITFINMANWPESTAPQPALKVIPEWYKKSDSYKDGKKEIFINSGNIGFSQTIKKCMPVFDSMTSGYILSTPTDIFISEDENKERLFAWNNSEVIRDVVDIHNKIQLQLHPSANQVRESEWRIPKWNNQWGIKTPKGYSCLFINPMHNPNGYFTILEGIVDTDTYTVPVAFPFTLNDKNFVGLIPAGTPIVQIIPFKRDEWKSQIGNEEDIKKSRDDIVLLRTKFFDSYKKLFRSEKVW